VYDTFVVEAAMDDLNMFFIDVLCEKKDKDDKKDKKDKDKKKKKKDKK
jgi:hypothetical protein